MVRRTVERVGVALLVVVFVALVLGQVFGQPTLIAYVDSGSMEPTIDEGDGFVAIPAAVTGPPSEGDVITFHAEEIEGGGLTTHRVVGETDEGYITRGDANPFTDQDGGEPPVGDDRIVAQALQIGDTVVTIPHLGTGIEGIQGVVFGTVVAVIDTLGLDSDVSPGTVGVWIFVLGAVLFVASFRSDSDSGPERDMSRSLDGPDGIDGRTVAILLLVVVLVPANAAMIVPSGPTDVVIDGDEVADAEGVDPGDTVEAEFDARNGGLITLLLVFEPTDDDVAVEPDSLAVPVGEGATATVSAPAPEPGGERTITIEEHRYLVVMPEGVLTWLHSVSPYAALAALNLFIGGAFLGFVGGLIGFNQVRHRDTSRDVPLSVRVKRLLR
ncbi:signal peptidase I [Halorubrum luteum]